MNDDMRGIAFIAGVQILLVVLGWCALSIVLKVAGYPDGEPIIRWTPLAVWLREHGFLFLLVPPVWTGTSIMLSHSDDRPVLQTIVAGFGVMFAFGVFMAFFVAAMTPYTRPLLIRSPAAASARHSTMDAGRSAEPVGGSTENRSEAPVVQRMGP